MNTITNIFVGYIGQQMSCMQFSKLTTSEASSGLSRVWVAALYYLFFS